MNFNKSILFAALLVSFSAANAEERVLTEAEKAQIEAASKKHWVLNPFSQASLDQRDFWTGAVYPQFLKGVIVAAGPGLRCSAFTVKPKPNAVDDKGNLVGGQIYLTSYRFYKPIGSDSWSAGDYLATTEKPLPAGGLRLRVDWAGPRPSHQYRFNCVIRENIGGSCKNPDTGKDEPCHNDKIVDCSKVVQLENILHDRACSTPDAFTGTGVGGNEQEGYILKTNQAG